MENQQIFNRAATKKKNKIKESRPAEIFESFFVIDLTK